MTRTTRRILLKLAEQFAAAAGHDPAAVWVTVKPNRGSAAMDVYVRKPFTARGQCIGSLLEGMA